MKEIPVSAIYIVEDKIKTKEEIERLNRLLGKIVSEKTIYIKEKDVGGIILSENWYDRLKRTGQKKSDDLSVIFSGFDWSDERNNPEGKIKFNEFIPGRFPFTDFRDKKQLSEERGVVCNSGYEIHTAFGCFHSCSYCHVGNAFTIMLDIEKFTEKLEILMKRNQWQKLYKYDNQSDILTLEPEYGATKKLIEFFSETDKYLMLYSKSNNVDHILNLNHGGHTITCWTISCEEVAERFEISTPSLEERITAARKCQEAGYKTRFRFSPIIPVKNWREKNAEMMEKVFLNTNPEVVSLETLCHMTKKQFDELFTNLEYPPQEKISEYELFSHEKRSEIYKFFIEEIRKHNKDVKISLCLETKKMWDEIGPLLSNGNSNNFFCCCGAKCVYE